MRIEKFDMKYLKDYFEEMNAEITKYQWPDPFESEDDARALLQDFLDEMEKNETLVYSILDDDDSFAGSVELHGISSDCPEVGVWIVESQQRKGYAYKALKELLDIAKSEFGKCAFFYEADIRNVGSTKLLQKFSDEYEIITQGLEELTTDSGKELQLQGYVLKAK